MSPDEMRRLIAQMSQEIADLRSQVAQGNDSTRAGNTPSTRPTGAAVLGRTWEIKITSLTQANMADEAKELTRLKTQLNGGMSASADAGVRGGFQQDQFQGRRGGRGIRGRGMANAQARGGNVDGGSNGGSADIAVGDGLITQHEKAVNLLHQMEASFTTDARGNRHNTYSNQAIAEQSDRVAQLKTEIDKTNTDIKRLETQIQRANNETIVTGVSDQGQAVVVHAVGPKVPPDLVHQLIVGQRIKVVGAPTKRDAVVEITADLIVPM
jgi:uncharacterized small protein (DUF1192 family)